MNRWITQIFNYWLLARDSLFYVPILISAGFLLVSFSIFYLDRRFEGTFSESAILFDGSLEDARDTVRLLLTTMITMTTLVISITMVALSLSASQLGPRIVKIFMGDRKTQAYVGVFFGSIAACFACLGVLHDQGMFSATPQLSVSAVFLLCFFNLFVLLAYVSHVAQSSVADNIVSRVGRETMSAIDRLCNQAQEKAAKALREDGYQLPQFDHDAEPLVSASDGYVQSIQYEDLVAYATKSDIFIKLECVAGDYLIAGQVIGTVYPAEMVDEQTGHAVVKALTMGESRTSAQDIQYSIRHLVEIAERALSPSMNDTNTALAVLQKTGSLMARLVQANIPLNAFKDSKGQLRVLAKTHREADIIDRVFSPIRHAGQDKPAILHQILLTIQALQNFDLSQREKAALELQTKHVAHHIDEHFTGSPSQETLLEHLDKVQQAFAIKPQSSKPSPSHHEP